MKHTIYLICLIFCAGGQLQLIAQNQERVYLQTDKQLYMSGELLWLKMYTTDTDGRLLSLSKIGYVELIRDSIPEIQVKLDIRDGAGAGWMELPVMLPTGYYRLIAYTRYMRNEGENVFFEKTVAIINPFHQSDILYSDEANTPFSFWTLEKNNPVFELSLDKSSYQKRDNGVIRIKDLPAENISIGISIAGTDPVLLANTAIDTWKKQLTEGSSPVVDRRYLPEYEGAIIDGVVVDLATGNPVANPQMLSLLSFPGQEIQLHAGQPNTNGSVAFYTQNITGKHELTTTAIAPTGEKYRIDMQSPFALHTPAAFPPFKPDSAWLDYLQLRNLSVQVAHAYSADSLSRLKDIQSSTDFFPQKRYILDDWTRFANMEEVFIEFISMTNIRRTSEGRRFSMWNEKTFSYSNTVLVLLDNIPVADHELMITYNPLLIKTIDLHFGQHVLGGHVFDGMIAFYTYKNDYPGITFDESTQIFDYDGAQPYRYFYAPQYDATTVSSPLPDFRHTLLWEPLVQSAGEHELMIPFTTSDIPGSYVITIEGIGANGSVIQAKQTFDVETSNDILYAASSAKRATPSPVQTETGVAADITSNQAVTPPFALPVTDPVSDPVSNQVVTTPTPVPAQEPATQLTPTTSSTASSSTASPQTATATQTITTPQTTTAPTNNNNILARVKIESGQRLTLIAERYYGAKVFWVYIYEYNKAKIGSNPNRILPGMEILVPDKSLYDIDANNAASIKKATEIQNRLTGN